MSFDFGDVGRTEPISRPLPPTGLAPAYDGPGGPEYAQFQPASQQAETPFMTRSDIRRRVMPRLTMSAVTACCLFVTVIFLIMVEIGNTHDKAALRDVWFIKLNFADVFDWDGTPGLGFEIADTLELYNFYQIGLWNYCAGMNATGIQVCSDPSTQYWFDPIQIFADQLNETVTLPPDIYSSLDEIKVCSHWMFGLFMTGTCLSFVLIPTVMVGVKSRWFSLGLGIITFLNALCVLAASVIATVMFVIIRDLFRDYQEIINIVPQIGSTMFAMMWVATAFALIAWLVQMFLSCFCASERDVRLGKKQGRTNWGMRKSSI